METITWIFIIAGIIILFFLLSHSIYITTSTIPASSNSITNTPVCGNTPYGCCPDGINYKKNFLGSNCPSSPQNPYTVGSNPGPNPYFNNPPPQPMQPVQPVQPVQPIQPVQPVKPMQPYSMPGSSTAPILPIHPNPTPSTNMVPTPYVTSCVANTTPYPNNSMIMPPASTVTLPMQQAPQVMPVANQMPTPMQMQMPMSTPMQ
jgi:hypothetical protein